jgi:hypothetical protein
VREEVIPKFTRFLYAARGVRLLPDAFNKYDYAYARSEAASRFAVKDIADGKGLGAQTIGHGVCVCSGMEDVCQRYEALERSEIYMRLRQLHVLICGPLIIGGSEYNFI